MALVIPIVAALVLLVLALVGYLRDIRRGVLALAGTLLGAILVGFWGDRWGQALAKRFVGADAPTITLLVNCAILLFAVLLVGYGGGLLLRRGKERPAIPQRLVGALLGLLNGAMIVGYVLRFAAGRNPSAAQALLSIPVARLFHDGLPLLFLAVALLVAALVLVRGLLLIVGVGRTPPAAPAKPGPTTGSPAPRPATQQDRQRDVMEKIERHM